MRVVVSRVSQRICVCRTLRGDFANTCYLQVYLLSASLVGYLLSASYLQILCSCFWVCCQLSLSAILEGQVNAVAEFFKVQFHASEAQSLRCLAVMLCSSSLW